MRAWIIGSTKSLLFCSNDCFELEVDAYQTPPSWNLPGLSLVSKVSSPSRSSLLQLNFILDPFHSNIVRIQGRKAGL